MLKPQESMLGKGQETLLCFVNSMASAARIEASQNIAILLYERRRANIFPVLEQN